MVDGSWTGCWVLVICKNTIARCHITYQLSNNH